MVKLSKFLEAVQIKAKYYPSDRPAIIYGEEYVTWKQLMSRINKLANALKKLGIKKGDKVSFLFYNSPQFLEANLAIQELGAIPVPMNYRYVASEMEFLLNNSDSRIFIFDDEALDELMKIRDKIPNVEHLIISGPDTPWGMLNYEEIINKAKDKLIKVSVEESDTAVIIYTGGTTGRPKGVMLSYDNILSNEESAMAFLGALLPPVEELDDPRFATNELQRRLLETTVSLTGIPEVFFENPKFKEKIIVVEQPVEKGQGLPAMTYAIREGKIKTFVGKPSADRIDGLVHMSVADQARDLANLAPLSYSRWGKIKFIFKLLRLMMKGRIKIEAKDEEIAKALKHAMRNRPQEEELQKTIMVPPLFHLASYAVFLISWMFQGSVVVFPKSKTFNPEEILKMAERENLKQMFLVPTMWKRMLDYFEESDVKYDLSSLTVCLTGAAVLRAKYKKKLLAHFPNAVVVDAFGQSEMAPVATMKVDGDPDLVKDRCVGRILDGIDIKVVNEENQILKEGEIGELCYKGASVMQGYYKDPEKTAETIDAEGYLHSGDLGYVKDGEVYVVERKKECINTGAEKVYPIEVEEIIYENPKVDQVVVIGVPDEEWGEIVRAVVIPKKEHINSISDTEIMDWCKGKIASFKKPRSVIFASKFPISPVGKVLRAQIREQYGKPEEKKISDKPKIQEN
ncbi:MAG: long-chain fatty acid--CoA ligase [Candidatus Lokiarchaeota archaeon]|nr:long-chain fatty acid--CoA ligase [Candidatus Lokiarchaeota archaeon]